MDPDGYLSEERNAEQHATFWVRPAPDGSTNRFGGHTDPLTGAQLQTFIDTYSAPRPRTDPDTGAGLFPFLWTRLGCQLIYVPKS